jgi:hypothetical protein
MTTIRNEIETDLSLRSCHHHLLLLRLLLQDGEGLSGPLKPFVSPFLLYPSYLSKEGLKAARRVKGQPTGQCCQVSLVWPTGDSNRDK